MTRFLVAPAAAIALVVGGLAADASSPGVVVRYPGDVCNPAQTAIDPTGHVLACVNLGEGFRWVIPASANKGGLAPVPASPAAPVPGRPHFTG